MFFLQQKTQCDHFQFIHIFSCRHNPIRSQVKISAIKNVNKLKAPLPLKQDGMGQLYGPTMVSIYNNN